MPTQFQMSVKALKKRGLSQKDICDLIGISEDNLSKCFHRRQGHVGYKYEEKLLKYVEGFKELDDHPSLVNGLCKSCATPRDQSILINGKLICGMCHLPI